MVCKQGYRDIVIVGAPIQINAVRWQSGSEVFSPNVVQDFDTAISQSEAICPVVARDSGNPRWGGPWAVESKPMATKQEDATVLGKLAQNT